MSWGGLEASISYRALHLAPDLPAAIAKNDGHIAPRFEHTKCFGKSRTQQSLIALRCAFLAFACRVYNRFRSMIRHFAKPGLMEEVHVTVKNVAAERRIGEHVINRFGGEMRQTVCRGQGIVHVLLWPSPQQRTVKKKYLV